MATIKIPPVLRASVGGEKQVGASGANVGVNPSLTITALAEHAISQIPAAGAVSSEPTHSTAAVA